MADIKYYDVIKRPVITEKSMELVIEVTLCIRNEYVIRTK